MSILSESRPSRTVLYLGVCGAGALLLLGATAAAAQETTEEMNARTERIAATYRLTEPVLKKYAALVREMLALARRDPALLDETADTNTVHPAVRTIYARIGVSEDELEKFSIAMGFAAAGSWLAGQSREGAQVVKEVPPVVRANMAFLKTHDAAIKTLGSDMHEMELLQQKRKAAEEPKEPPARS